MTNLFKTPCCRRLVRAAAGRALALSLTAGLLLLPARANLGETVEQSIVRYGVPSGYGEAGNKSPFGNVFFKAGPYVLLLFVLNDREVGARVSRIDKGAFSDSEMQTILDAETDPHWVPAPSGDSNVLQWSRSDHATALYDRQKRMLIFTSAEMAEALKSPALPSPSPAPGQ